MKSFAVAIRHLRRLPSLTLAWLTVAVAASCTLPASSLTCGLGQEVCGGRCVTIASDPANCGACAAVCTAGAVCSQSSCKATCDAGLSPYGSSCVNPLSDAAHCGGCNAACQPGLSCTNGFCACPAGAACNSVSGTGAASGAGGSSVGSVTGAGGSGAAVGTGASTGTGATVGTGASTGTGGAGAGSGTGGGTGAVTGTGGVAVVEGEDGGYLSGGNWKGYVWTAVDATELATITPTTFETVVQPPYCVSGNVPPTADWSAVAMWGWTLNQERNPADCVDAACESPKGTITPALSLTEGGVIVNVTNTGASELRLQIQGPNGATDENDRWCAVIGASGEDTFIAWSSFNTQCWQGGDGVVYAGEPLDSILVTIPGPGEGEAATAFNFCINSITEGTASGAPPGAGCDLSGSPGSLGYTLTGSEVAYPQRDGHTYVLQNNVWNGDANAQSIAGTGVAYSVTAQGNSIDTAGAPRSFPSVFVGSNHGRTSNTSTLPKAVSAIVSSAEGIPTGWRWSGSSSGAYNATYDVWFSSGAGGDAETPSGAYLMVWFHSQGVNGGTRPQPKGSDHGVVTVAGRQWNLWYCGSPCQDGVDVFSYVPVNWSTIQDWSFNLKDFIQHSVDQGQLQSSWYLTNVFTGYEIWSGGVGLKTDNFCAVVP